MTTGRINGFAGFGFNHATAGEERFLHPRAPAKIFADKFPRNDAAVCIFTLDPTIDRRDRAAGTTGIATLAAAGYR